MILPFTSHQLDFLYSFIQQKFLLVIYFETPGHLKQCCSLTASQCSVIVRDDHFLSLLLSSLPVGCFYVWTWRSLVPFSTKVAVKHQPLLFTW